MKKEIKKLVTHDGSFHTDDIFAAATLSMYMEKRGEDFEIIRTRDPEKIRDADYVFDVGGIYDADKNRFDHHQKGGAGKRTYGDADIEYASFGLVWKKFGIELCANMQVVEIIDKKLSAPIDAWDNAHDLVDNKYKFVSPFYLQHIFFSMEPTWREEEINIGDMFTKSVSMAKHILSREIIQARDAVMAEEIVTKIYNDAQDKRILTVDKNYPFQLTLGKYPEPLYIIYPRKTNGWWGVKAMRDDPKSFHNRKDFPVSWAGARDEELQKITGVDDAVFCHRGLYMCVAKTKEGAMKLAKIALES